MEQFREILRPFTFWAAARWEEVRGAPALLWKWTGTSPLFRGIAIALTAAVAVLLVYLLVSFFRANWKGKLRTLLVTAVAFLAVCALLLVAQREVAKLMPPETETVTLGGETLETSPQYSLARGMLIGGGVDSQWVFTDAIFTTCVGEDLILQLSGLDSLCAEDRYYLDRVERPDGCLHLHFSRIFNRKPDEIHMRSMYLELDLWVLPNTDMRDMGWYLDAGQTVSGSHIADESIPVTYTVAANSGDEVAFFLQRELENFPEAGLARQIGPDTVLVLSRGSCNQWVDEVDWSGAGVEAERFVLDPLEEDGAALTEPLRALFDGNIRCLRGLTEEEQAAVLPGRIADVVVGDTSEKNGGFAFPCVELLEMAEEPAYSRRLILRFLGPGPDGESCLYTLLNGNHLALFEDQNGEDASWFTDWGAAYEAGVRQPDEAMSAFLGAPAVAYEDGWLLNPGAVMGRRGSIQNYYYLTLEPQTADAD